MHNLLTIFTIANEIIKHLKDRDAKIFSVDRTKNLLSILQLDSDELEFEIVSIKNHARDFGSINLSMAEEFMFLLSGKYQKWYMFLIPADDFFLVMKNKWYFKELHNYRLFIEIFVAELTFHEKATLIINNFRVIDHAAVLLKERSNNVATA